MPPARWTNEGSLLIKGTDAIDLSLIIPAYNEEARLASTLPHVVEFLSSCDFSWEVIISDDGSEDATPRIARDASELYPNIVHLRLPHRGKAATVRSGVEVSRGQYVVFTDADLSTPIHYTQSAFQLLTSGWDLVIGSREGAGARRIGEPAYRHIMGRFYNYFVQLLAVPGVRDTQCGFKGFRADVARDLFGSSRLYQNGQSPIQGPLVTGFDVELLFLARKRGYRLYELPVTWHHVEGSKVRPGKDSLLMFRDALQVRLNDMRGRYDIRTNAQAPPKD